MCRYDRHTVRAMTDSIPSKVEEVAFFANFAFSASYTFANVGVASDGEEDRVIFFVVVCSL